MAKKQHMFEIYLVAEDTEASVLVSAYSVKEATKAAFDRVESNTVSWEGRTPNISEVTIEEIDDLGVDVGM